MNENLETMYQVQPEQAIEQPIESVLQPKPNNFLVILLSILLLLAISTAGFFAFQTQKLVAELRIKNEELIVKTPEPIPTYEPGLEPEPIPIEILTKDWKTYTNNIIKISLKYPTNFDGKNIQVFEPETNTNTVYLNNAKYGTPFLDIAVLPNTQLTKWYPLAYNEAKQKTESPPVLIDGPVISGYKSQRSTFYIEGSGESLVTFVQKGSDLYQIVIPTTNNETQELIISTIEFLD